MAAQPPARSLMPREHGAYGQLALPLLTALLSGHASWGAPLYAAAAVFAFCAHEPLLVLLGQRGARVLREAGGRARVRLVSLAALALLCAGLALALSRLTARLAFAAPLGGALLVGLIIWRKQERTAWGEISAACALAAAGLPVAIAGGVSAPRALGAWGVWSIGFGLVTLSLRRAIHGHKGDAHPTAWSLAVPPLLVLSCWLIARSSAAIALAALPMAAAALGLFVMPPSPKRLRQVGWLLMVSALATGFLLVREVRGTGA